MLRSNLHRLAARGPDRERLLLRFVEALEAQGRVGLLAFGPPLHQRQVHVADCFERGLSSLGERANEPSGALLVRVALQQEERLLLQLEAPRPQPRVPGAHRHEPAALRTGVRWSDSSARDVSYSCSEVSARPSGRRIARAIVGRKPASTNLPVGPIRGWPFSSTQIRLSSPDVLAEERGEVTRGPEPVPGRQQRLGVAPQVPLAHPPEFVGERVPELMANLREVPH